MDNFWDNVFLESMYKKYFCLFCLFQSGYTGVNGAVPLIIRSIMSEKSFRILNYERWKMNYATKLNLLRIDYTAYDR